MKINRILIILFILVLFKDEFIQINAQIVHGPKLNLGKVDRGDAGINITQLQRYDWSWCRVHIRDNFTNFQANATFHPRVDEFTTISFPNSNISLMHNPNITIWLEFPGSKNITTFYTVQKANETKTENCTIIKDNKPVRLDVPGCKGNETTFLNVTSYIVETKNTSIPTRLLLEPKHIYNPPVDYPDYSPGSMINSFTVIIQLDKGVIIDAMWDGDRINVCKDCEACLENQCAVKPGNLKCDEIDCQLKIFVAWVGLDKKGKKCISINKIPSAFRQYSATPLSQLGLGLLNDFIYRVDSNTVNPQQA